MFKQAVPVWLGARADEMNLAVAFTATVGPLHDTVLALSASTFYRLFVNGKFVASGPARTAKGYARVDVLPLGEYDGGTANEIRIEVVAYHCMSLSTCLSRGFLCAELRRNDDILAATGRDFSAALMREKRQKVERYSVQRHFGEVWDFTLAPEPVETVPVDAPIWLDRVAPYPHYGEVSVAWAASSGAFTDNGNESSRNNRYSWHEIPAEWGRFTEDEIPHKPLRWLVSRRQEPRAQGVDLPLTLSAGEFALFDLSQIECGFLRLDGTADAETDLVIGFSETCDGDTFSFSSIDCQNVVEYRLPAGHSGPIYTFEPYALRSAIVMVRSGAFTASAFGVKTFERDMTGARIPDFPTETQAKIYNAALRTFAHNAVDLYSDCPSRERAGWLCDSYFTGYAEYHFLGEVPVEDAFLENHRLCRDERLPHGMLAMCYPADIPRHQDGGWQFIPQWCMWYVLELRDYLTVRNPAVDRELYRASVEGILGCLAQYENSDGLLEDLPSWNFVEWSDANQWTQNVNYPTNFLYAAALLAGDALYGNAKWREKARRIQKTTAALSFDGELFTDQAVREADGALRNTGNTSEAGQYYALLFGGLDLADEKYAVYLKHIRSGCRGVAETGRRFVPVNAFIGLYLRLKSLLELGEYRRLLDEVEYFFGGMADRTGTLWEYREGRGSLDHGFASYAAYAMCVALEHLSEVTA